MKEYIMSRVTCLFAGWNKWVILVLILACLLSCNKKDSRLPFEEVPEIQLLSMSHDTIQEYEDVLVIRIKYTDGDGDLGFEEPDKYALFVRDVRLEDFDNFYLGPVAPPDERIAVEGELDIELPSLFLFGNSERESTYFEIKMRDRAGNESNLITTERVIITREE